MRCNHLQEAKESYLCHFKVAGLYGLKMIAAGFCLLLHAICPWICLKTGSTMVNNASDFFKKRAAASQIDAVKQPDSHPADQ